jgi:hypothetical protein
MDKNDIRNTNELARLAGVPEDDIKFFTGEKLFAQPARASVDKLFGYIPASTPGMQRYLQECIDKGFPRMPSRSIDQRHLGRSRPVFQT